MFAVEFGGKTNGAVGYWYVGSWTLPSATLDAQTYEMTNWGSGVERGIMTATDPTTTMADLGKTLEMPANNLGFATNVITISRYDASGNLITDAPVTFNIIVDVASTGLLVYRYPDASSTGILLTSEGGSVTDCDPVGRCYTVTSPFTSSFVGFNITSSPSPSSSPSPNPSTSAIPSQGDGESNLAFLGLLALIPAFIILVAVWRSRTDHSSLANRTDSQFHLQPSSDRNYDGNYPEMIFPTPQSQQGTPAVVYPQALL